MIAFFTRHSTAANILMVSVLLLGAFALPKLQIDTFPLTPTTTIQIKVSYPGATPAEVTEEVCYPLEEALDVLSGIKELSCDAQENQALARVEIEPGENIDTMTADIQQQVSSVDDFPDQVQQISVTKLDRIATVMSVAITGAMPARDLYRYAQQVKQRLKANPLIAQVSVSGFSAQQIDIRISQWQLQQYGLSIVDLAALIQQQSTSTPVGIISSDLRQQSVRFTPHDSTVADFKNIIVKSATSGAQVHLGDIADIRQIFSDDEDLVWFAGQRAAQLQIAKTYFQNTLSVRNAVLTALAKERALAPAGIELHVTQDTGVNIKERLRILTSNGLQGLLLAFLMLWAFFNVRFSFWVAMGLPVSFLGSVFVMYMLGYTLNMMTMVGLIVAIGLLMDDSLIIAENIAAKRQAGLSACDAAILGTKQVFPGVIASFLTTLMVIGPLMFLSGKLGEVLRYIPIILLITLLVSLLEAFFILPFHLAHSRLSGRENAVRRRFIYGFEVVKERLFVPASLWAIRFPYFTLAVLIMLVLVSSALLSAGILKFKAMPALESDVLQARILLPQGSLLQDTQKVVGHVSTALTQLAHQYSKNYPDSEPLIQNTTVMYGVNADASESGPHMATVSADLLAAQFRHQSMKSLIQQWKRNTGPQADVESLTFSDKERGLAGNGIDIRMQGSDFETLYAVSHALRAWLAQFSGVFNVTSDLRYGRSQLMVTLNDNAAISGISAAQVAQTLRSAVKGSTDLHVFQHGEVLDVVVRLDEFSRKASQDELQDLMVTAANGTRVPLASVANFTYRRNFAQLTRINGENTVTVQGNINTQVANAREIMQRFYTQFVPQMRMRYPGVHFVSEGQDKETQETGTSLMTFFALGVIGIYLILAFLFANYWQPFAVLLAIPMGWIGVIWGHVFMGLDLTIPSLVGFATLAGIVVNDNILLVTFIKQSVAKGHSLSAACGIAVRERFRAIFITSMTTFAGLLPLLAETSTQAQFLVPLIASIAFGLVTATLLASVVVPCVLLIQNDWQRHTHRVSKTA